MTLPTADARLAASQTVHTRQWTGLSPDHQCGSCYACCVWLGIDELRKWTGQACSKLNGAGGPERRCSIYPTRPTACQEYQCFWRVGFGPESLRPADSGILITPYPHPTEPEGLCFTVMVFDPAKARPIFDTLFKELIALAGPKLEIRLINIKSKSVLYCTNGLIYNGKLSPSGSYETLSFTVKERPIGAYADAKELFQ